MKKITIIILHLGYGGMQKAVCSLANMLADNYHIEILSIYKIYELPAYHFDSRVEIKYLINSSSAKKEWLESIKKFKIISFIKYTYINFKVLILKSKRTVDAVKNIKSEIIISNEPYVNKRIGKNRNDKIIKIAIEHSHHNNNESYINDLLESLNNIDYLLPVSNSLKEFYQKKLINTKTLYILLCLDEIPVQTSKLNNKNLIMIGRLSPEKAFDEGIRVLNEVIKKDKEVLLHIVGDGIEKDKLNKLIKEYDLNNNIIMHGFQNKDKINELLLDSSIYLMLSHAESFGLTVLESMSYGLPVLAFDSAKGPLEIVDDGITGKIVKNRNITEMADEIIKLLNDKKSLDKFSKEAKKKSTNYSFDKVKKTWLNFLEEVLGDEVK